VSLIWFVVSVAPTNSNNNKKQRKIIVKKKTSFQLINNSKKRVCKAIKSCHMVKVLSSGLSGIFFVN
jgi:hypothetical protein